MKTQLPDSKLDLFDRFGAVGAASVFVPSPFVESDAVEGVVAGCCVGRGMQFPFARNKSYFLIIPCRESGGGGVHSRRNDVELAEVNLVIVTGDVGATKDHYVD